MSRFVLAWRRYQQLRERIMSQGKPDSSGGPVFYKDRDGTAFHTYSCCARGIDMANGS